MTCLPVYLSTETWKKEVEQKQFVPKALVLTFGLKSCLETKVTFMSWFNWPFGRVTFVSDQTLGYGKHCSHVVQLHLSPGSPLHLFIYGTVIKL